MPNSDFNSLPVAPEFVDALAENAYETTRKYLEKTNAPQELVALVDSISELGYYLKICYSRPESLMGEKRFRFDIEEVVIKAVNAIAAVGGEFQAPVGNVPARVGTMLAESEG